MCAYFRFVYRTIAICLGVPPTEFTWQYLDKTKKYNTVGPITPQQFYEQHVKSIFNLEDKVRYHDLNFMP